jgi:hypothetical protein
MVDCPNPLQVGVEMIVSLNLYIKASAFTAPLTSRSRSASSKTRTTWHEVGIFSFDHCLIRLTSPVRVQRHPTSKCYEAARTP